MKIQPRYVVSLLVLVAMFIAARIYVGRAIQQKTYNAAVEEAIHPRPPKPPARASHQVDATLAREQVLAPISYLDSLAGVDDPAMRKHLYEELQERTRKIDARLGVQVAETDRAGILAAYAAGLENPDAQSVEADLNGVFTNLKAWWSTAEAPEQPVGDLGELLESE